MTKINPFCILMTTDIFIVSKNGIISKKLDPREVESEIRNAGRTEGDLRSEDVNHAAEISSKKTPYRKHPIWGMGHITFSR